MKLNIDFLKNALLQELPGSIAYRELLPENRAIKPPGHLILRQSAVLLPVFEKNNKLHLLLTKRNRRLKHHPGQISFPGGKCEKDEQALDTALRETEEEIGMKRQEVEIIGKLSELYIPVSGFNIHPYIGFVSINNDLNLNKDEVEEVLDVPLESLLRKDNINKKWVSGGTGKMKVPCYFIDDNIIWGATSMLIAELVALLRNYNPDRGVHSRSDDTDPKH